MCTRFDGPSRKHHPQNICTRARANTLMYTYGGGALAHTKSHPLQGCRELRSAARRVVLSAASHAAARARCKRQRVPSAGPNNQAEFLGDLGLETQAPHTCSNGPPRPQSRPPRRTQHTQASMITLSITAEYFLGWPNMPYEPPSTRNHLNATWQRPIGQ